MNRPLSRRLDQDYITVYRISSLITHSIGYALIIAYTALAGSNQWTFLPAWIALAVVTLSAVWFTWFIPLWKYRSFQYELFDEELELASGIIFKKNVLIPMVRVQHVELESGPLMRKYKLASVKVVTAATTHEISGLKQDEASDLKRQIGLLAKVDDQDD
ncbi:PH domain-containing protein [Paenibacillus radicis (ex Gao et al. 2016)]|uniref:Membrane protein n=1 Tax=Paenibacillus radicis (ex Gao et al. 2016) TaxID=1737354 RepID=A0A917HJE5_9BACL|nr:PH domain-containing protein [Paenibacillus radicis (ex Gao et al. 2016)]GGG81290.1 membrane protein [Paenibacillus radicis (ex Gao et al. 2016)]